MKIETFEQTVSDQLQRLGGTVHHTITPETRGYTVTLSIYPYDINVSKFYTESDVNLHSTQLIRTQVTNLYRCLTQKVLNKLLGEGVLNVL